MRRKEEKQSSQYNMLHVALLEISDFGFVRLWTGVWDRGCSLNQIITACSLRRGESCPCPGSSSKCNILNPGSHTFQLVNELKMQPSVLYHVNVCASGT